MRRQERPTRYVVVPLLDVHVDVGVDVGVGVAVDVGGLRCVCVCVCVSQEWLTDLGITFTAGPMNLNWKNLLMTINDDDHFWDDVDEYGVSKPQG